MEKNYCSVVRNGLGDGSGYWMPEANCCQQQVLMPLFPFSMAINASASDFANSVAGTNQVEELDIYLLMQIKQIKSTLELQWKQHLSSVAMNLEAKFLQSLIQKDNDIAEQKKKVAKLIELLKKAILEREKWEKIARKLNGIVSALNQTLQQVQKPCVSGTNGARTEEKIASCYEEEEEEGESDEPAAKRRRGRRSSHGAGPSSLCQICSSSAASVLVLPCRHLCLCKKCEALDFRCPVCTCVVKETMEVVFS